MYLRNLEPSIEELLDDPIAHLLMRCDGIDAEIVRDFIEDIRRNTRATTHSFSHAS